MNLIEFKEKKYGDKFVDTKKVMKEWKENENKIKKYFFMIKEKKEHTFDFINLKKSIIWKNK